MQKMQSFFQSKQFIVIGASNDPSKYGYKVLIWYTKHDIIPIPINPVEFVIILILHPSSLSTHANDYYDYTTMLQRGGHILGLPVITALDQLDLSSPHSISISFVTPPTITQSTIITALQLGIRRIWLQPGSYHHNLPQHLATIFDSNQLQEIIYDCILVQGPSHLSATRQQQSAVIQSGGNL